VTEGHRVGHHFKVKPTNASTPGLHESTTEGERTNAHIPRLQSSPEGIVCAYICSLIYNLFSLYLHGADLGLQYPSSIPQLQEVNIRLIPEPSHACKK